jgi:hypothetical protein
MTETRSMEYIGQIVAEPDPPGIDHRQWMELIGELPCLAPGEPKEGINPFARSPMLFRPSPDFAWVIVDGNKVGTMDWAGEEWNCINVCGERQQVIPIAQFIADTLGGRFVEHFEDDSP